MLTKADIKHKDIFNGNILTNYNIVTSIMRGNYFVGERAGRFTVFRAVILNNCFRVIAISTADRYTRISDALRHVKAFQSKIYHQHTNNLLN